MSRETGVTSNNLGIDPRVPNMGQWLSEQAGYEAYYCGKWHASGPWNYPEVSGSRRVAGFKTIPVGAGATGDFSDYQVSSATVSFLSQYRGASPFLFVAGLMNPHDICFWIPQLGGPHITQGGDPYGLGDARPPVPPNNEFHRSDRSESAAFGFGWTEEHWRNYAYDYYRMVERVDADVGRILDALEERDDDTVVIFTSDHGEALGRHNLVQKWHPYDHSLKVPLICSRPGEWESGRVDRKSLVMGVDVMATVCDAAGVAPPPQARGRSLEPLLKGESAEWRESVFAECRQTTHILRTQRFKYVKAYAFSQNELRHGRHVEKPFVGRNGEALAYDPDGFDAYRANRDGIALFDLEADPWETRNLAGDGGYGEIAEAHDRLLREQWESRLIPGVPEIGRA